MPGPKHRHALRNLTPMLATRLAKQMHFKTSIWNGKKVEINETINKKKYIENQQNNIENKS